MGLKSSCAIFEKFSSSLEWLAIHRLKASAVLHILDDFLFISPSKDKCSMDLSKFLDMCDFLGVPIAQEKTVGPDTTLQFAGIELDSVRQEARLPLEKLTKCRTFLIAAKCNTNAKCNNIDAKCNKVFNAKCNNFSNA